MKLIDADKLIKDIVNLLQPARPDETEMYKADDIFWSLDKLIKQQSTAYDVDKVVSELEKSHFHTDATFDDDGYCNDDSEEVVNLNEAIEIVKAGGIDEKN